MTVKFCEINKKSRIEGDKTLYEATLALEIDDELKDKIEDFFNMDGDLAMACYVKACYEVGAEGF